MCFHPFPLTYHPLRIQDYLLQALQTELDSHVNETMVANRDDNAKISAMETLVTEFIGKVWFSSYRRSHQQNI